MKTALLKFPRPVFGSLADGRICTADSVRLISAAGATLIAAPDSAPDQAESALRLLRGLRATGRRLVWFDTTELAETPRSSLSEWGRRIVEWGGAHTLVVTGTRGREAATAARDAGLALSRVVVCNCDAIARNLLADLTTAGDVLLALGVDQENIEKMQERLEATPLAQAV